MVVDKLDVRRARRLGGPRKSDAPLVVHANAVLALSVTLQRFETVAGQRSDVLKDVGRFEAIELQPRWSFDS